MHGHVEESVTRTQFERKFDLRLQRYEHRPAHPALFEVPRNLGRLRPLLARGIRDAFCAPIRLNERTVKPVHRRREFRCDRERHRIDRPGVPDDAAHAVSRPFNRKTSVP